MSKKHRRKTWAQTKIEHDVIRTARNTPGESERVWRDVLNNYDVFEGEQERTPYGMKIKELLLAKLEQKFNKREKNQ